MVAAEGILTARGGMTSHAAVVARGMGKCCVSGCAEIKVDEEAKELTIGEYVFKEGDYISLDGTAGDVLKGQIKTVPPELSGDFAEIMSWADEIRTLKIRTNADNPRDAKQAVEFGAEMCIRDRGRTLDNSFIILDEAQNTTPEQMKMFLTRMGFGSRVVVTGDVTQIDLPRGKKAGLIEARRVLRDVEEIRFCELKDVDVVRHQLVKKVIKAYDDYYRKHPINEEGEE